jgi:endoribonuclease Dicer
MGKDDDFRPRPYQEHLMNLVKEENAIIYLPTGSGKTFIAVMLIKEMSASLDRWVICIHFLASFLWG